MPISNPTYPVPPTGPRYTGIDSRIHSRAGTASVDGTTPANRAPGAGSAPRPTVQRPASEQMVALDQKTGKDLPESSSFSFLDLIDIINPLHHIPVLGTIYRAISGDDIKAPARILGGGVFGGIAGAVSGLINTVLDKTTGRDLGEHLMAVFNPGEQKPADQTVKGEHGASFLASATPPHAASVQSSPETGGLPELTYNLAKETARTDPWERGIPSSSLQSSATGAQWGKSGENGMPLVLAQALDHYDQAGRIKKVLPEEEQQSDNRRLDLFY